MKTFSVSHSLFSVLLWSGAGAQNNAQPTFPAGVKDGSQPGEMSCRDWGVSDSDGNYFTCQRFAWQYGISTDLFFHLNPQVKRDCSNVTPNTLYCKYATIIPLISTDGNCGPQYKNATCLTDEWACCNSQTWKCGNSTNDCAPGICWGGICDGYTVYTIDGKCGYQNQGRQCAGKWGSCCSMGGVCGNGTDFCGDGKCQSGNCTADFYAAYGGGTRSSSSQVSTGTVTTGTVTTGTVTTKTSTSATTNSMTTSSARKV